MIRKMVALQFCTVGVIILLKSFTDTTPYVEFSVEWYKSAGLTITLTVAVLILSSHLANGSLLILRFLR